MRARHGSGERHAAARERERTEVVGERDGDRVPRVLAPATGRARDGHVHALLVVLLGVLEDVQRVRLVRDVHLELERRVRDDLAVPADHVAQVGRHELQLSLGPELAEDAEAVGEDVEPGGAPAVGGRRVSEGVEGGGSAAGRSGGPH